MFVEGAGLLVAGGGDWRAVVFCGAAGCCGAALMGWVVVVFGSLARSWAMRFGSMVVDGDELLMGIGWW